MIAVSPYEMEIIQKIIQKNVPHCDVLAFGSRLKWTHTDSSDLDLAVRGKEKLDIFRIQRMKEAFMESDIPYKVDVSDYHCISDAFRKIIDSGHELIYEGSVGNHNWKNVKAIDFIDFNPRENISKGVSAKKIAMEQLLPFTRDILGYEVAPFNGGSKFRNGDTLMARITPCLENGKTAQVNILEDGEIGFGSTEFIVLRAKPNISDKDFIYYLAMSPILRDKAIKSMVGSSGRQRVQQGVLNDTEFFVPPLAEQIEIGRTLKTIDDKIALNNKINICLEKIVQAIFKSWFVDFEPWGGVMPNDWSKAELGEYCMIKSGFAFKSSWWQEQGGVKVIKIKNITNIGLNISDCSFVSDDKVSYAKDFIACAGDIVIAMTGATIGKFSIIPQHEGTLLINQRVGKFFLGKSSPFEKLPFLWCTLKHEPVFNEIISRGQGSAQPNISPTDIMTIQIVMPSKKAMDAFNKALENCFEIMATLPAENEKLSAICDTLLPRLMSGEIKL